MKAVFGDWPVFGVEDDVRPALAAAVTQGEPVVLATLAEAAGGAPFGVGAQMLFTRDTVTGFLTGGCVEADVALHAAETFEDGAPRRLVYGDGGAVDIRLPCGGRIDVLLERVAPRDAAVQSLLAHGARREPALWVSDGRTRACLGPGEAAPAFLTDIAPAGLTAAQGRAARLGEVVLRRFDPVERLAVVGRDPIALAIAALALAMGWATTLIRPQGPEAPPPLDGLDYRRDPTADALAALSPDPWTAVVVATHERDGDEADATAAVLSGAGYVGLLGSTRRLPARLSGLIAAGAGPATLSRLSAPVGLDIGAVTPREIAVSVIGEVVQHARSARSDRLWPFPAAVAA